MSGAYTAAGTSLEFHGTGDTILDNKGITFEKLCICDGSTVNNIGSSNSVYQSISGAPLIMMGNNTTLNLGRQISLYTTLPSRFILHGSNSIITGSAVLQMLPNGADSLFDFSRTGNGSVYIRPNQTGSSLDLMGDFASIGLLRIYIANAYTFTFKQNNYTISSGNLDYGSSNSSATGNFYFAGTWNITGNLNATAYNSGTVNIIFGALQANIGGNITRIAEHNITGIENTQFTLNGSGAQTVTSNGKQFGNLTVNNTGTATIKFLDSLSCLGDLSLLNGRDSLMKIRCVNYTNTTDDSVFQTDTGYVSGNWLRNNANVSRVGGRWVHVGSANTQITLQDAGTIGPITIRKSVSTATLTAASNTRAWRIKDTIGPLIMGSYSVACTTFKNYAVGTQLAAVTLDTLDQFKTMTIGGGTITRWNWGANNISANLATGTTLTVASIDGIGGTAGAPDTLQGVGGNATVDLQGDTVTVTYFTADSIDVINGLIIATDASNVYGVSTSGIVWAFSIAYDSSAVHYPINTSITSLGVTVTPSVTIDSFYISSGALPTGLSLNASTGAITGTPTAAGTSTVTITASNNGGLSTATDDIEIIVAAAGTGQPIRFYKARRYK